MLGDYTELEGSIREALKWMGDRRSIERGRRRKELSISHANSQHDTKEEAHQQEEVGVTTWFSWSSNSGMSESLDKDVSDNEWNEPATGDINSAWEVKRDPHRKSVQGRVNKNTTQYNIGSGVGPRLLRGMMEAEEQRSHWCHHYLICTTKNSHACYIYWSGWHSHMQQYVRWSNQLVLIVDETSLDSLDGEVLSNVAQLVEQGERNDYSIGP